MLKRLKGKKNPVFSNAQTACIKSEEMAIVALDSCSRCIFAGPAEVSTDWSRLLYIRCHPEIPTTNCTLYFERDSVSQRDDGTCDCMSCTIVNVFFFITSIDNVSGSCISFLDIP